MGRPSVYSFMNGLSGWESRAGLTRTIQRLEKEALLETEGRSLDRVIRLSRKGRESIKDFGDPEIRWNRKWDGKWRAVLFDIPESDANLRQEFRRKLVNFSFGGLQKSIWISPDPFPRAIEKIKRRAPAPAVITFFECTEFYGGKPTEIARAAWNFNEINERYESYIDFLNSYEKETLEGTLDEFLADENRLWAAAVERDPFLPNALLLRSYLGKKAYAARKRSVPELIQSIMNTTIA